MAEEPLGPSRGELELLALPDPCTLGSGAAGGESRAWFAAEPLAGVFLVHRAGDTLTEAEWSTVRFC